MSAEESQEGLSTKSEINLDLSAKMESSKLGSVSTAQVSLDGSGDHASPSETTSTSVPNISDDSTDISSKNITEKSKELGDGDQGTEIVESELQEIRADKNSCIDPGVVESRSPISDKEEIKVLPKPTFLENLSSIVADDVDSENQDEDFVLKYDDDEETSAMIVDNETEKKSEEDPVLKYEDDDDEETSAMIVDNETEKKPEEDPGNTNKPETSSKIAEVAETAVSKGIDFITELKSSEDEGLDEDLLSEIDAQIAELGESLSKAENENVRKAIKSELPTENLNDLSENVDNPVSISKEVISIDTSDDDPVDLDMEEQHKQIIAESITASNTLQKYIERDDNNGDREIEEALLNDIDNLTEEKDESNKFNILAPAETLVDYKSASPNADLVRNEDQDNMAPTETQVDTKSAADLVNNEDKNNLAPTETQVDTKSAADLVNNEDKDNLAPTDNKSASPEANLINNEGQDNLASAEILVDNKSAAPKTDLVHDEDINIKTEDEITENAQKDPVIDIEVDISGSFDEKNVTFEENAPNSTEILANSTKLDNSIITHVDSETSSKYDTFQHDSFSSIEARPHGVNRPNVMLEIPTQELIDLDDSMSLSQDKDDPINKCETEAINIAKDLTDEKVAAKKSINESGSETISKRKDDTNQTVSKASNEHNLQTQLDQPITTEQNALEGAEIGQNVKTLVSKSDESEKSLENIGDTVNTNVTLTLDIEISNANDNQTTIDGKECNIPTDVETNTGPKDASDMSQDISNEPIKDIQIQRLEDTKESEANKQSEEDISSSKEETTKELLDVPSTSQSFLRSQPPDPSDDSSEVADATDSLGLLAESSRVRDEDDADAEPDDQEISDHDDYDDDFDPDDESSNQQTAEQSEDSTQHSESDLPKPPEEQGCDVTESIDKLDAIDKETTEDTMDKEIAEETTDKEAVEEKKEEEGDGEAEKEFGFEISNVVSEDTKEDDDADIEIEDDIVCEEVEVGDGAPLAEEAEDVGAPGVPEAPAGGAPAVPFTVRTESKLRQLLLQEEANVKCLDNQSKSPSKKLVIAKLKHVVNIVDLESSSDDESGQKPEDSEKCTEVTSINISKEIEVMSSGDNTSEIISKEGETVINVPKTAHIQKIKSRLNTSEITIKTATSPTESTLVIPETKMGEGAPGSKFGALEVFNLDSDDEDITTAPPAREPSPVLPKPAPEKRRSKCINAACTSDGSVPQYPADRSTAAFYESKKKRPVVCQLCLYNKAERAQKLIQGIKNFTPLLELEEPRCVQELVEISDSESDEEGNSETGAAEKIGAEPLGYLESLLAGMFNATWDKFNMDARLQEAQDDLNADLERLEKESAEVNQMLDECQTATDKLRGELYATFDVERHSLPALAIYDTPDKYYICSEAQQVSQINSAKRRLSSASESQAKKSTGPSIDKNEEPNLESGADGSKLDDDFDKDVSVVTLSNEVAPAELPPTGELERPPLQSGQVVFAMRHAFGSWIKAKVLEVTPKGSTATSNQTSQNFTLCRVKFENKSSRNAYKLLPARCLAYAEPAAVRMTIGTRIIALFKDTSSDKSGKRESFYSGVVAEVPNPVNKYRYLVFFDDGYAQYVTHADTRPVCEFSSLVWEEVHPFSREFVREYLMAFPERPMVRLHTGQSLKTEWNGKWWLSKVLKVDASLVNVYFEQDKRTEWIYRGSTRLAPLYLELQAAEKHRARPLPRNRMQNKLNMPYVEYTRCDEQEPLKPSEAQIKAQQEEIRRQRAVAKKSTTAAHAPQQPAQGDLDAVTSRVVYYTPKNAVKPYKWTMHTCGPKCKRTDVLALKDLRTYNPLAKPLLSGWERQIIRYKGHKDVMYRAPCGRRLRNMAELHRYLRIIQSDMGVDLFDFGPNTHCLAEFVLNKCIVGKKDLSHGKENVPVPCVNYYDESLPEFCSYNTERTPTAGVPLNLDPDFLCGCDCTDDCQDKSKCACWQMTLEGARTIGLDTNVGYVYKRLPEPLPSGIYECNVRCKCKSTCLNRVAQHPLQLKLQVFKTLNRGWGIRALNDVPKGSFLCIYAGNLLTDATANLDGLNEGDEYLAELDYIEVVEQMKEGYEDDIPDTDKKLDRKENAESESEETESEEETNNSKSDTEDGDFEPGYIPGVITGFNKRLRRRDKKKQKELESSQKENQKDGGKKNPDDDCITISDDEELREPSRFAAQAGMGGQFISKYRSVRTLFGKDEACYIMDAKVQGNIGRYLNHSCSPNVFVQNVFVDTHDPRFPWVAFFALAHIRAGTELTWNYNYDIGSVPGKALYCYCGAPNCRGRLL